MDPTPLFNNQRGVLNPNSTTWFENPTFPQSRNTLIFKESQPTPLHTASNIARYLIFWSDTEEDRMARRLRREAFNLGFQELAKKNAPDVASDNFSNNS
uniref:Uncharacterized protein n=1 Tax=Asparagus officinalis TaxID=4686 RepID=Q2AAA5_ASPOF|nr:hypothetical protein 17.t00021 [Asparagus officinalis]